MRINHLTQADISIGASRGRFWMDTCGGRDQVALTLLQGGWEAYERPLPKILALWCNFFKPIFIDVGANTGFYSLVALACKAKQAYAFEPVDDIAVILEGNVFISEMTDRLTLYRYAVGAEQEDTLLYFPVADHGLVETSASLNKEFRVQHSSCRSVSVVTLNSMFSSLGLSDLPVIVKIDVETYETSVLKGADRFMTECRPAIIVEILPGSDIGFFEKMCSTYNYQHYSISPERVVQNKTITCSMAQRDHIFLPSEKSSLWVEALRNGSVECIDSQS